MNSRSGFNGVIFGAAFVVVAGLPSPAEAHLVNTGLGPVYDGIGHVLVSPEDLIPVIAISLLAGLRGTAWGRVTLFVLPVAWAVGGVVGYRFEVPSSPVIPAVSFLLLGLLVAADVKVPKWLMVGAAVVVGGIHGTLNGRAVSEAGEDPLGLIGMSATVFVLVALLGVHGLAQTSVGANRGARGGELDRRHRAAAGMATAARRLNRPCPMGESEGAIHQNCRPADHQNRTPRPRFEKKFAASLLSPQPTRTPTSQSGQIR